MRYAVWRYPYISSSPIHSRKGYIRGVRRNPMRGVCGLICFPIACEALGGSGGMSPQKKIWISGILRAFLVQFGAKFKEGRTATAKAS